MLRAELESLSDFAMPDRAVARSRASAESWRDIYERHFEGIYRLVYRCGVPASEVDDLTQTVFLRAFSGKQRLLDPGSPGYNVRAWLYGIALRVVSEHRRWARVRRLKAWLVESTSSAERSAPETPEEASAAGETQRRVGQVLALMSSKLSAVLVLRDIDELSLEETANILGIPENTVRSRLRLAREKFERLWTEREEQVAR